MNSSRIIAIDGVKPARTNFIDIDAIHEKIWALLFHLGKWPQKPTARPVAKIRIKDSNAPKSRSAENSLTSNCKQKELKRIIALTLPNLEPEIIDQIYNSKSIQSISRELDLLKLSSVEMNALQRTIKHVYGGMRRGLNKENLVKPLLFEILESFYCCPSRHHIRLGCCLDVLCSYLQSDKCNDEIKRKYQPITPPDTSIGTLKKYAKAFSDIPPQALSRGRNSGADYRLIFDTLALSVK